ncbi:MAG: hypothetical protein KJZ77_11615 [Anaerolineales bacterium]|nr:hypothetical protein [Anaerolineales bacterium]
MNNQLSNTKPKIRVVQKAKYIVLIPEIAWLIFSIWAIKEIAFPQFLVEDSNMPLATSTLVSGIYFGLMALWIICDMVMKKIRKVPISVEQKAFLPFFFGGFLLGAEHYLGFSDYMTIAGLLLIDILPIVAMINLLQGKSFGIIQMYQRDVQIVK